eukprot:COSAG02_NODE_6086_length_3813_cov_3.395261_3_plen_68_part_00
MMVQRVVARHPAATRLQSSLHAMDALIHCLNSYAVLPPRATSSTESIHFNGRYPAFAHFVCPCDQSE